MALLEGQDEQQQMVETIHNAGVAIYERLEKEERSAEVQEQYARVRAYHERSLAISEDLHDEPGVIASLSELVDVAIAQGDHLATNDYLERLMALLEGRDERQQMVEALYYAGVALYKRLEKEERSAETQKQYRRVRTYHERGLAISEVLHYELGVIANLRKLIEVAIAQGDHLATNDYLERLMALLEGRDERQQMVETLYNAGVALYKRLEKEERSAEVQKQYAHVRAYHEPS